MASLFRVRTTLTGFPGGPGVATMYFLDTNTAVASVRAFWLAVSTSLPSNLRAQVEHIGDEIESSNGNLLGTFTKAPVAAVLGTNPGVYSAPTGATVSWLTSTVVAGRRLRGRTFIVPTVSAVFANDGTLNEDSKAALQAAADSLLFEQSLSMVVWSRPADAVAATPTRPARAARNGSFGLVTGTRVPDKAAVLRSRRD